MRIPLTLLILAALASARPAAAQSLGTDLFGGGLNNALVRVTPGQPPTTVGIYATAINMLTMDNDNFHVIAMINPLTPPGPIAMLRVDPSTGAINTVWNGAPLAGFLNWVEVDQNGDYTVCTSGPNRLFTVFANGGGVTTIHQDNTSALWNAFVQDRVSGNYAIGDFTTRSVVMVDRSSGQTLSTTPLGSFSLQGMVQDPHDSDIYIASLGNTAVVGYDPITNATSVVASLSGSFNAIAIDRAPANDGSLIYVSDTNGSVQRVSRTGTALGTIATFGTNVGGFTFNQSRNVSPILQQAPNFRFVRISFPKQAGRLFGFALSASGYAPGLRLPDGRTIPLVPDSLFFTTAQGPLAPLLVNNAGTLSASGEAFVTFNVNALGNSVRGVRIWGAAVTLDPSAPLGIGEISAPVLFVL